MNELKSSPCLELQKFAEMPKDTDGNIKFITANSRIDNILFVRTYYLIYYLKLSENIDLKNVKNIEQ